VLPDHSTLMADPAQTLQPQRLESHAGLVQVGGLSKAELLSKLRDAQVQLNQAAIALFADDRFETTPTSSLIEVVHISVGQLGLSDGATFTRVVERAAGTDLSPCALEIGPHLRLQLTDQPEEFIGNAPSKNCAPPGSITVASVPLSDDDEAPKGFYLRRIGGVLWLRGYRSWPGHLWSPADVFAFARSRNAA